MMAIRDDYLDVYYRGGRLLNLVRNGDSYKAQFDEEYDKGGYLSLEDLPGEISTPEQMKKWVDAFPSLKHVMDIHFGEKNKLEREFQQAVVRENNFSSISNETEYFITDIEYTEPGKTEARFDMLGLRWPANERTHPKNCRPVLIEMKYGDGALEGESGLSKHLTDIDRCFSDPNWREGLVRTINLQFRQLRELDLVRFGSNGNTNEVEIQPDARPEVVFLLANSNPRSSQLETAVEKIANEESEAEFDLRFFASTFAGYGMHRGNMLTTEQFRALLQQFRNPSES